jgi:hypothetical protein
VVEVESLEISRKSVERGSLKELGVGGVVNARRSIDVRGTRACVPHRHLQPLLGLCVLRRVLRALELNAKQCWEMRFESYSFAAHCSSV